MNKVFFGDCLDILPTLADDSIDACVTDPPYGLKFMGKDWDHGVPGEHYWREVMRVLKPGANLLAFGGTRTFHRLVCAIEDAGFEVRDQIAWLYGSGFPKSLDVSKAIDKALGVSGESIPAGAEVRRIRPGADQEKDGSWEKLSDRTYQPHEYTAGSAEAQKWSGWGTALKPAMELICLARKPLMGTVAKNVMRQGTGALNIDACRIPTNDTLSAGSGGLLSHVRDGKPYPNKNREGEESSDRRYAESGSTNFSMKPGPRGGGTEGRWPANVIHDGSEEVLAGFPETESGSPCGVKAGGQKNCFGVFAGGIPVTGFGDSGSAARFFYTAKANQEERKGSKHPTVKPLDLMRYLVRLVTPPGGIVLDPFAGTGTTGQAALMEGMRYVLIERDEQSIRDIETRMKGTQVGFPM